MYVQRRYTIGKALRKKKKVYKKEDKFKYQEYPFKYKEWADYDGLICNGVKLAEFYLKNGLSYRGLIGKLLDYIATRQINANQTLISVPAKLILNTKIAFHSGLKSTFKDNANVFINNTEWEENILMAFLIDEKKKGKNSKWHLFIEQLPQDIDVLMLWNETNLNQLEDESIKKIALKQLAIYLERQEQFKKIFKISDEEFKWAFTNLHTRDFGYGIKYKSLVPFVEYVNHENVDVHTCVITKKSQQLQEIIYLNDELISICSSSESDDSFDEEDETLTFCEYLEILYINPLKEAIEEVKQPTLKQETLDCVSHNITEVYKEHRDYKKNLQNSNVSYNTPFNEKWPDDDYNYFLLKTQSSEIFEEGAQIYFNYGRLSNKQLLMRYGIALEFNKYDHYYLRIELEEKLKQKFSKISIKLKYTEFPISLIRFCKAQKLNPQRFFFDADIIYKHQDIQVEVDAIEAGIQILETELKKFKDDLKDADKLLSQTTTYNEYFALIYRLEQQRIIFHNLKLLQVAKIIIEKIMAKQYQKDYRKISGLEQFHERKTNQLILQKYFCLLKLQI